MLKKLEYYHILVKTLFKFLKLYLLIITVSLSDDWEIKWHSILETGHAIRNQFFNKIDCLIISNECNLHQLFEKLSFKA